MAKKNNGTKNKSAGRRVGERVGAINQPSKTRYVTKTTTPRSIYKKDSKGDYVFDYYEMEPWNIYADTPRSRAELNRASGVKQRPRKFQNRTQLSAKSKRRKIRN